MAPTSCTLPKRNHEDPSLAHHRVGDHHLLGMQEGDGTVVCNVVADRLCHSVPRPGSGWDNGRAERDATTTRGDAKLRDGPRVRNARLDPRGSAHGAQGTRTHREGTRERLVQ